MTTDVTVDSPVSTIVATGFTRITAQVVADSPVSSIAATGYSVNVSVLVLSPVSEVVSLGSVRSAATVTPTSPPSTIAAHGYLFDILATGIVSLPVSTVTAHGFVKTTDAQVVVDSPIAYVRASGKVSSAAVVTGTIATVKTVSRDMQLPKVPNVDKQQRNWMDAVQSVINRRVLGIGNGTDRLVDLKDLLDAGVVGVGAGGNVTGVSPNVTKPPLVTGLSVRGVMTTIILNWNAPSFSNFGLVEIWRSDNNNIGEAFRVGTSVTNFYQDAVGTGATKYYWVRSISTAGVAGDFAADGLKGKTSLDPAYVMQLLTSQQWSPNSTYQSYQYVRGIPASPDDAPFPFQNFQYVCLVGGISGTTEPTWPVIVGDTVADGTITWQCRPLTEKVPFTIGNVDGVPSVVMSQAFIEDASIKTAQIHDLAADKITAGTLAVGNDIQVGSKLWGGFSEYANPTAVSGFWIGLDGGLPRLALDTGGAELTRRYIRFNGDTLSMNVDIFSGADGHFDDLDGDSVNFNRALFTELIIEEESCTSSDYVREGLGIPVSDPLYLNYLCYKTGVVKSSTMEAPHLIVGGAPDQPYAFIQTPAVDGVACYDYADSTTKYRAKKKEIGFNIYYGSAFAAAIGAPFYGALMWVYIYDSALSTPSNYYNNTSPTYGIPTDYLAKIAIHDINVTDEFQTVNAKNSSGMVIFSVEVKVGIDLGIFGGRRRIDEILIKCETDNESLGYIGNRKLRSCIVFKQFDDDGIHVSVVRSGFQIDTTYQSNINIADNDPVFVVPTPKNKSYFEVNASDEKALRALIAAYYDEPL